MQRIAKPRQIVTHCPCGNPKVLAKGREDELSPTFWGAGRLYLLWDGTPQDFDYLD